MSSTHRRKNSTDPRPGNEGFPRMSLFNNKTSPTAPRMPSSRHSRAPSGSRPTPRAPTANTPNVTDSATKMQINQTFSIAMMASPLNPLPFCLPIPLGVAMLLGPQAGNKSSPRSPPKGRV